MKHDSVFAAAAAQRESPHSQMQQGQTFIHKNRVSGYMVKDG